MAISATKMIYNGQAYKTVGQVVEAILVDTKDVEKVFAWFGGKTASLSSAVSVAKKNLGLTLPKVKKVKGLADVDEDEVVDAKPRKISPKIAEDTESISESMFCPYCGKANKANMTAVAMSNNSDIVSRSLSIKCSCGKHSTIVVK